MYDLFQKLEGNVRLNVRIDSSLSIGTPFALSNFSQPGRTCAQFILFRQKLETFVDNFNNLKANTNPRTRLRCASLTDISLQTDCIFFNFIS